ncbi:glycosyltransferase family 9 protein [Thalassomonas haliotis]|uniref:Glycosyltransferase family 9 protein n=1 Tax=Thalassomonas haliotis TaxID=485448 RepID=A0ABY7VF91_9GAMM|nr:glycosyltransferase family 9 protein [Thalassomonas haliotis]WDE11681.1 glycosyltransferase family 9 protein [Thalassomonas haliotis]
MPGQITAPKNLCLLRLSAIGDVCHAVAMVQHIQRHWPETKITWVIGKIEASLLQGLDNVEFIIFDKRAGLQGYRDLRAQLKSRQFELLLHMQVALRASLASLCIPARVKIGFDRKRAIEGQWLFTNKGIAAQEHPHVLDGFMGFARALGLEPASPQWQMPITDQDMLWASELFSGERPLAVICPAASKAERNWHARGYAQAADHLAQLGFLPVICGGPTALEQQLAGEIIGLSQTRIENLVGRTSLKQLLAVLKLAHLVIAPDTGPAHMAVTVNTPVIGLYAHSNPHRTGPYLYQHYVVSCYQQAVQKQYGKPLSKLPWGIRAKGSELMHDISIEQVKDKIRQLVADHYPELSQP